MVAWIVAAIGFGTILMLAACGEILTEKSGHLNLGVPGIMYVSAFVGFITAYGIEKSVNNGFLLVVIPILVSLLVGGLLGALYCFMCVTLKCNQNVMGLALTTFGVGFGKFLSACCGLSDTTLMKTNLIYTAGIPGLKDIPVIGPIFLGHGFVVYLAIIIAVLIYLFLNKTKYGMNLKAVGESPQTADAVGINVSKYKYIATITGCSLCGFAGFAYVVIFANGLWATNNNIEGIGWLAVALVIFASWKTVNLIWGSYLFGLLYWTYNYLPSIIHIPAFTGSQQLWMLLPYIITVIVLIVNSLKKKHENQPPASLGVPYYRENR